METAKFLEQSGLLINSVSETIQHEAKEKNVKFLATLFVHLVLVY